MHSNCILDSVANLFVRHVVFVGIFRRLISRAWILLSISGLETKDLIDKDRIYK